MNTKELLERATLRPWHTGGVGMPLSDNPTSSLWGPIPKGAQSGIWIVKSMPLADALLVERAVNSFEIMREALREALSELRLLGRDLQEIQDGERTFPTALLDEETVDLVRQALALSDGKRFTGELTDDPDYAPDCPVNGQGE